MQQEGGGALDGIRQNTGEVPEKLARTRPATTGIKKDAEWMPTMYLSPTPLASNPGTEEGEKSAWYPLFVHALIFLGIPDKTTSFPWLVDVRFVFITISRSYFVNNGDFIQDLDKAVSYLQRLGCAAMTLEPNHRASLK